MANKKISDLTAGSALTGAELIEIEQSSSSAKAALNGILKTYLDTLYEIKTAYLADVKAVNTAGGTATSGSRFTRTLIEVTDPDSIVSVTASEFTLAAGTYFIKWISPAFAVDSFQTWLRNVTDSTDPIIGSSEFSGATAGSNQCSSSGGDIITIAGTKVFRIEMQVAFTSVTNGLGKPSNYSTSCVYTQVWIQKIP